MEKKQNGEGKKKKEQKWVKELRETKPGSLPISLLQWEGAAEVAISLVQSKPRPKTPQRAPVLPYSCPGTYSIPSHFTSSSQVSFFFFPSKCP